MSWLNSLALEYFLVQVVRKRNQHWVFSELIHIFLHQNLLKFIHQGVNQRVLHLKSFSPPGFCRPSLRKENLKNGLEEFAENCIFK